MAKYHLSVGSQEKDDSSESLFPTLELSHGLIDFDFDLAASVPIEEDIRARADLWTGNPPPDVAFCIGTAEFCSTCSSGSSSCCYFCGSESTGGGGGDSGGSGVVIIIVVVVVNDNVESGGSCSGSSSGGGIFNYYSSGGGLKSSDKNCSCGIQ